MITGFLYYCTLLVKELLLFSTVPVSIETVMPIRIANTIYLMVTLAIYIFEDMRTRLSFFGSHLIHFLVFHTIPHFLSVIFSNISSIALGTPRDIKTITECQVTLFPAVLILWNTWVHICVTNGHNETSNVKMSINDVFCQRTTLEIPDIHPNNHYIGFRKCFDDT